MRQLAVCYYKGIGYVFHNEEGVNITPLLEWKYPPKVTIYHIPFHPPTRSEFAAGIQQ
jgi:hypothetical protein